MKTVFFEARKRFDKLGAELKELDSIEYGKIGLLASVQYTTIIGSIKKELEKRGKKVLMSKTLKYPGQILGCDISAASAIRDEVDAFLLIGSGRFHAYNVAVLGKPVMIWQPGSKISIFPADEIEKLNLRKKAMIARFIASDKIGVLVSTKPGQQRLDAALKVKKMLEKKGKEVFLFISDTIQKNELENFKIDVWINTACPSLIHDLPNTINLDAIKDF